MRPSTYILRVACCVLTVAMFGCGLADIAADNARIKGRVRLSDNPPAGHGGVTVRTDMVSTVSATDGTFALEGVFMYETEEFYVAFEKPGYIFQAKLVKVTQNKDKKDVEVDIGTITLQKF